MITKLLICVDRSTLVVCLRTWGVNWIVVFVKDFSVLQEDMVSCIVAFVGQPVVGENSRKEWKSYVKNPEHHMQPI